MTVAGALAAATSSSDPGPAPSKASDAAAPSGAYKGVTVVHGADSCTLLLFEGGDSAALVFALNSRFGLGGAPFHLTMPGGRSIVPLTAALPDGLTLHLQEGAPGAGPAAAAASAAARPREPAGVDRSRASTAGGASFVTPLAAGSSAEAMELGERGSSVHDLHERATVSVEHMREAAANIDRFSRLSTDLANERTLLAWLRTAMAAIRTALSFIGISAEGPWWMSTVHITRISMLTAVLVATVSGVKRYVTIKDATYQPVPPQHFGRISIHYFNFTLAAAIVALAIGMYPDAWSK